MWRKSWFFSTVSLVHILMVVPQPTISQQPPASILLRMLEPFDVADERQADETTNVQVVHVPIELSLIPETTALRNDIEVVVSVVGGTATVMLDFNITSTGANETVITLPAGMRHREIVNISLTIADDFIVEEQETIVLFASTMPDVGAPFALGANTRTIPIMDDDVVIGFERRSYMVNEDAGSVEVCAVVRFGSFRNSDFITFRFTTMRRTAIPGLDYNRIVDNSIVTYQQRNMGGRICRTIGIINDNRIENTTVETFRVILRRLNQFGVDVRFMPSVAMVIIIDDDDNDIVQPGIVFALLPPLAMSGETNNLADIAIQITLTPPTARLQSGINVMLNALGGSAGAQNDYVFMMNPVNFPAGTRNGAIEIAQVRIIDDVLVEGTENAVLVGTLPAGTRATFRPDCDRVNLPILDNDLIIGFTQPHYKVNENAGCVAVCVEILVGEIRTDDVVTFEFVLMNLNAVAGDDYVPLPPNSFLTFREGNANRALCKEIQIINDDDDEGLEEFRVDVVLLNEVGVQANFNPFATIVKIIDNDGQNGNATQNLILFAMLPPPTPGDERRPDPQIVNIPIQVTISPTNAVLQNSISVEISVLGGTADLLFDYNILGGGVVNFPAGSVNGAIVNVEITVIDDLLVEGTETAVLLGTLPPDVGASFIPDRDRTTLTIFDNEVVIGFQQAHYKVNEGDGCVRVCVEVLSGLFTAGDSVSFSLTTLSTANDAMAGTDFTLLPSDSRLTFREGNMNQLLCKEIQIIDDLLVEPLEQFQVIIVADEVISDGVQATFEPQATIVKIIDDDQKVVIGFQQIHYKVSEGDGCVQVCVEVLAGMLRDTLNISIPLQTVDSTAFAGEDYVSLEEKLPESNLLIFREGNVNRPLCTEIQIIDNGLVEPLEEFQVEIVVDKVVAEGLHVVFDARPATVKIIDDDNKVIIGFQQIHYKVNEGDGCVRVCVEVLAGRLRATDIVSFTLTTSDISARSGKDYVPIPDEKRLTFREGNMNRPLCKEIPIIDDNYDESLEEFLVTIDPLEVESEGVEVGVDPQTTTVKIIDNDSSPPADILFALLPPPTPGDERIARSYSHVVNIPIQITLSPTTAELQNDITVTIAVLGGTADSGSDYSISLGAVNFPVGTTNGEIRNAQVTIIDDFELEVTETAVFVGTLPPGTGASFRQDRDITTLTIFDNEVEIGFVQVHYKVEEDAGCVQVCVEVKAGELRGGDGITFELVTFDLTAFAVEDYVPIPVGARLSFREGNMNRPQCKEIQIIDDTDVEGLHEFGVAIDAIIEEGVETSVDPRVTKVKIIDNDFPLPSSSSTAQPPGTVMMTPSMPGMTPSPTPSGNGNGGTGGTACPPPTCIICNHYGYHHGNYSTTVDPYPPIQSSSPMITPTTTPTTTTSTTTSNGIATPMPSVMQPGPSPTSSTGPTVEIRGVQTEYLFFESSVVQAEVCFELLGIIETEIFVSVQSQDGTATVGEDYQEVSETLTFFPFIPPVCVVVVILDDFNVEENETFILGVSSSDARVMVTTPVISITILDDDDINECADGTNNCVFSAICQNTIGSFTCICPTGFTGDGTTSGTGCTQL